MSDPLERTYERQRREAQQNIDRDLIKSLRNAAYWADKRSLKLATILRMAADRIEKLDPQPQPASQPDNQPASAPQR